MTDRTDIHPEAIAAPGYLANHAATVFNRVVDAALRPHGVTLALIGPVMLLSWQGPMAQRDLVCASAVKQPAMVALLRRLETMDLIARTPHESDRRSAMIALTERGQAIAAIGREVLLGKNARALCGFSALETDILVALLHRLIGNLEADEQDGGETA
ncbi:MarR family transcriptional regulator [uncultured Sphingomonas sp.]|uniref:MarR family winged helix-turn-helix transcriptional regulator n=1 Tax=uncultured Sphingomonas sp. TaxID=158754 RepID=UPI0025EECB1C|nr:MarR family transcriptional regulator [uncultured Sphingomonas sp.]